jgi:hypothetical protein
LAARPSPVTGLALFTYQAESAFETLPTLSVFFQAHGPGGDVTGIRQAVLCWEIEENCRASAAELPTRLDALKAHAVGVGKGSGKWPENRPGII